MNLLTFLPCGLLLVILHKSVGQAANVAEEFLAKYSCDLLEVQELIVNKHNELRSLVDPPPANMLKMVWNEEAAANALAWAKQCKQGHSKPYQRETKAWECGENLYMPSRPINWTKVIQGWFDEQNYFKYGKGKLDPSQTQPVGHFTQCAWADTFQVGCGCAYCPKLEFPFNYVCQYCPVGNEQKKIATPYIEGDKCSKCPNHCVDGLCSNYCYYVNDFEDEECDLDDEICDYSDERIGCMKKCMCTEDE